MNIKKSVLAVSLMPLFSSSAFSIDIEPMHGFEGRLGRKPYAVDIMRLSCGALEGITVDHASVHILDLAPITKPRLSVMIGRWDGHACVDWSRPVGDPIDDDPESSAERAIPMPAFRGQYCVMVFKTRDNQAWPEPAGPKTAVGGDFYELNTHCTQEGVSEHAASTLDAFLVDM